MLLLGFRLDLTLYTLLVLITKIEPREAMRRSLRLFGRDLKVVALPPRFILCCNNFGILINNSIYSHTNV